MHPEFPDEDIMALFEEKRTHEDIDKWIVCFDGASNALGHGVGAVLVSPDDQCIPFTARLVSYPNFVRGPLLDDEIPRFPIPVFLYCIAICRPALRVDFDVWQIPVWGKLKHGCQGG